MRPESKTPGFSRMLVLTTALLVVGAVAFGIYVSAEKAIDRANEQRYVSLQLASELRQSSDDLTRMARTYVLTGDPAYKQHYHDIIAIRDGLRPRPEQYQNVYWDLYADGRPPRPDTTLAIPLLTLMQQAAFGSEELSRLEVAKANSDRLTVVELSAMELVAAGGADIESRRATASRMLHDEAYHQAKAAIMQPISDFNSLMGQRTLAAVRAAESRATAMRFLLIAIALGALYMLWQTYGALRRMLGAPVDVVHAQIVRLGQGDFSSGGLPASASRDSVVGWLEETRIKLDELAGGRRHAEQELARQTQELALHNRVLQLISSGAPLAEVFEELVRNVEARHPGTLCSVLLLDEAGRHFCNGVAPSLPGAYNQALDGLAIGDGVGSCGTAAWRGERVVVEDIEQHPYWAAFLDLARQAGVKSCWSQPFKDKAGKVLGTFAIYHREPTRPTDDETQSIQDYASLAQLAVERARNEEALQRSRALYRLMAENSNDVIWLMEMPSFKFTYISPAVQRMRGWTPEEVMAQPLSAAMTAASAQRVERALKETMRRLAAGDAMARFAMTEVEQPCKDGRIINTEVVTTMLLDAAGNPSQVLGITRDITERKRAEAELERHRHHLEHMVEERTVALSVAKEAAEAASRAKSTFLANMSHELRTPMNAIMGMTDLALRRASDPQQKDQLSKVAQAARHLLAVINDILDISRIEADRMTLENIPFRLGSLLENLNSMVGEKAREKGLALVVDISPQLAGLALLGDPLRIGQILVNLVGNAIKFTERGEVVVQLGLDAEDPDAVVLRIEVSDTGIGIAPQAQTRLFSSFEQADGSMSRRFGGSGLGLAICKRLAEMMGGNIGVNSQLGVGSTFCFTARFDKAAPLAESYSDARDSLAEERLRARHRGARILLVEDEPVNQEVSSSLLETAGLCVDLAVDGSEAVDMAAANDYDLILMDVQMPKMNGLDATRVIRSMSGRQHVPILAMTANAFDEDRLRCLEAGMNDHIGKPVDPAILFATIGKWLDGDGA